jgi:hypothetical protein
MASKLKLYMSSSYDKIKLCNKANTNNNYLYIKGPTNGMLGNCYGKTKIFHFISSFYIPF